MVSLQQPFGDAHVIYEYTRQQAIEDRVPGDRGEPVITVLLPDQD